MTNARAKKLRPGVDGVMAPDGSTGVVVAVKEVQFGNVLVTFRYQEGDEDTRDARQLEAI